MNRAHKLWGSTRDFGSHQCTHRADARTLRPSCTKLTDEGGDGWTGACARGSPPGDCLREYVAVDIWADAPPSSADGQPVLLLARAGEDFSEGTTAEVSFTVGETLISDALGDGATHTVGAGVRLSSIVPDAAGVIAVTLEAPLPRDVLLLKFFLEPAVGATLPVKPIVLNATGGVVAEAGMALQPAGSQLVVSGLGVTPHASLPEGTGAGHLLEVHVAAVLAGQPVCLSAQAFGVQQQPMVVSTVCRDGEGNALERVGAAASDEDDDGACHAELTSPPPSLAPRQLMVWDAPLADIGGGGCVTAATLASKAGDASVTCECLPVCTRLRDAASSGADPACAAACTDDGSMVTVASLAELRGAMANASLGAIALTADIVLDRQMDGVWMGVKMGPSADQLPYFGLPQLSARALTIVGRCGEDGLSPCVLDGARRAGIFLVGPEGHLTLHNVVLQNALLTNAAAGASEAEALAAINVAFGGPALSLVVSGSAWLSSVTIRRNRGVNGGAMAMDGQGLRLTCEACSVYDNWAVEAFRASGMAALNGTAADLPSAAQCSLYTPSNGAALWSNGARNAIQLANSSFVNNKAWFTGGALFVGADSELTDVLLDSSIFLGNQQQGTEEGIDSLKDNPICGGAGSAALVSTWSGGVGAQPRGEVDVFVTGERVDLALSPWPFGTFGETPIGAPGLEWKSVVAGAPSVRAFPSVRSSQRGLGGASTGEAAPSPTQRARALFPEQPQPFLTLLPLPRYTYAGEQPEGDGVWCTTAQPDRVPPLGGSTAGGSDPSLGFPCVVRLGTSDPPFVDPGAAASKYVFGDRTHLVTVTTNYTGDNAQVGAYLFAYEAVDAGGVVAAAAHRWVIVEDRTPPAGGEVNWSPFVTDPQRFAVTWRGFADVESTIVGYEWGVGSEPYADCTSRGDAQATCPDVRAFDRYSSSVGDECSCKCIDPRANYTEVPCDPLPPVLSPLQDGCTCPPPQAAAGACQVEYTCVYPIWERAQTELGDGGQYHGIVRARNAYGRAVIVTSPPVLVDATPPALEELAGSVRCGPFCLGEPEGRATDDFMAALVTDVQSDTDGIVCCWPSFADAPRANCSGCAGSGVAAVSVELVETPLNVQKGVGGSGGAQVIASAAVVSDGRASNAQSESVGAPEALVGEGRAAATNGAIARPGYSGHMFSIQAEGGLQRSLRDSHSYEVRVVATDAAGNVARPVVSTKPAVIDTALPPEGSALVVFAQGLPAQVGAQQVFDPPPVVALLFPAWADMERLTGPYFVRVGARNTSSCMSPAGSAEPACFVALGIGGRRLAFVEAEFVPINVSSFSGDGGKRRLVQIANASDPVEGDPTKWCARQSGCFGLATLQDLVIAGPSTNDTFGLTFDMSEPAYNLPVASVSSPDILVRKCLQTEVLSRNAGFDWCEPIRCGVGQYLDPSLRNGTAEGDSGDDNATALLETAAASACVQCPVGTASAGAATNDACAPCAAGTFASSLGFGACTPCPQGFYQTDEGQAGCLACPGGSTTIGLGASSEEDCRCKASFYNTRQFQAGAGNVADTVCLLGFDPTMLNLDTLQLCGAPPGQQADGVAVTADAPCPFACPIEAGALCARCAVPAICAACPEGGTCAGFEQLSPMLGTDAPPVNARGFWGDPRFPTEFYECAEGRCEANYTCSDGYAGTLCDACADGFSRVAGDCLACGDPGWYLGEALLIPLILAAWVGLNLLSLRSPGLVLMLTFFQKTAALLVFDVVWPSSLERIFNVLSFFAFSVNFITPSCIFGGWSPEASFFVQAFLPAAAAALHFGRHALLVLWLSRRQGDLRYKRRVLGTSQRGQAPAARAEQVARRSLASWRLQLLQRRLDRSLDHAIAASASFLSLALVSMLVVGLAPISCMSLASGDSVLRQSPTVSCSSSLRTAMLAVGVITMALVLFALAWFLWMLHGHRLRNSLEETRFKRRFGWLYDGKAFAWLLWEGKVIADKCTIVALGILLPDSAWQLYLAIAVTTVSLGAHLLASPFLADLHVFNCVEGVYLWAYATMLLAGFIFQDDTYSGTAIRTFATVLCYVFLASGLVVAIASVVYDLRRVHLARRAATDVITQVGKISERLRAMSQVHLSNTEGAMAQLIWAEEESTEGAPAEGKGNALLGKSAGKPSSQMSLLARLDTVADSGSEVGPSSSTAISGESQQGDEETGDTSVSNGAAAGDRLGYAMLRRRRTALGCVPAGERRGLEDRVHQRYVIYPQENTFATFLKPGIANAWARGRGGHADSDETKLVFDVLREVDTEMRRNRGLDYYSGSMDSYLLHEMVSANPALLDFLACADQASVDDFRHFFLSFSSYYRAGGFDPVSTHIVSGQKFASFVSVMLSLDERSRHMVAYTIRVLDASRRGWPTKADATACLLAPRGCCPSCATGVCALCACCGFGSCTAAVEGDAPARPGGARGAGVGGGYALYRRDAPARALPGTDSGVPIAASAAEGSAVALAKESRGGGDNGKGEGKGGQRDTVGKAGGADGYLTSVLGHGYGGPQWHGVQLAHAAADSSTVASNIRESHRRAAAPGADMTRNALRPSGKLKTPGVAICTSRATTETEGAPGVRLIIPGSEARGGTSPDGLATNKAAGLFAPYESPAGGIGKGKESTRGGLSGKTGGPTSGELLAASARAGPSSFMPLATPPQGSSLPPLPPLPPPPVALRMARGARGPREEQEQAQLRARYGVPDSINVRSSAVSMDDREAEKHRIIAEMTTAFARSPGGEIALATPTSTPAGSAHPSPVKHAGGDKADSSRGGKGSSSSSAAKPPRLPQRETFRKQRGKLQGDAYASCVIRELEDEGERSRERLVGLGRQGAAFVAGRGSIGMLPQVTRATAPAASGSACDTGTGLGCLGGAGTSAARPSRKGKEKADAGGACSPADDTQGHFDDWSDGSEPEGEEDGRLSALARAVEARVLQRSERESQRWREQEDERHNNRQNK